jgi:uncharacterized membrane protein YGL010W
MVGKLFNVRHQLTFYGAYHTNKWNVLIHIICVPIILWSAQVFLALASPPSFLPSVNVKVNDWLQFESNWTTVFSTVYWLYYMALEPVGALLYLPQLALSTLFATAFAHHDNAFKKALALHVFSWIAQFVGHGAAEGRAPALLDNILGAVVLAPFFVHLEILFALGYKPKLHKEINNSIGVEVARLRREKAQQKRDAAAKRK